MKRHPAAIFVANVVGYSRMMGEAEEGALGGVTVFWKEQLYFHHGRAWEVSG
jgi:hypothetical protein